MALIKQHCEFFDEEVELRYDQYRRTDTQEHRNELSAAAAAVINEASRKKLSLSFTTANLDPDPHWCEQTVALVQVGNDQNAGRIVAYQVCRSHLRWNSKPFHYFLDLPTQDNCNIANAVFNRHGQLKQHLYGNFGAETDQGELLYIRDIQMKPQFRKKGLACLALKLLLRKLSQRQQNNMKATEWWFAVMHKEDCEDSWRAAGFRVLNRTCFLACCAQKGHKCWDQTQPDPFLLIDNVQPPKSALDKALLELIESSDFHNNWTRVEKAAKLLGAGADMQTSMAVQHAVMAGQMQAVSWLIAHGADIDQQDSAGNTALHFAAHSGQPAVVKELLASSASRTIKTKGGYTPLDVCLLEMQFWREYKDARMDGFKGHHANYMDVIQQLLKTGIKRQRLSCLPVPTNKWGCTCGECLNGYLSPRMQYRLQQLAEGSYDNGMESLADMKKYPANLEHGSYPDGDLWLQGFIPARLLQKVSKLFALGWTDLMDIMNDMLTKGIAPTATAVKQTIERLHTLGSISGRLADPKAVIAYLREGGRVEYALDALIGRSREESEITGDGSFADPMTLEELEEMKACENDNDYTFVLRQLCNDGFMPSGPFLPEEHGSCDWQRLNTKKLEHSPPSDDGQYE